MTGGKGTRCTILLVDTTKCLIRSNLKEDLVWALGLVKVHPIMAGKAWWWEQLLLQQQEQLEACSSLSTNQGAEKVGSGQNQLWSIPHEPPLYVCQLGSMS